MVEPVPPVNAEEPKAGTAAPAEPARPAGGSSVFFQFIVFPLAIVLIAITITGIFTWLSQDRRSYEDYLNEIANGWAAKRGQAAYELSFRIADRHQDEKIRLQADVAKTLVVFEKGKQSDPEVRRYLAIVLGHLGKTEAVPALVEALEDQDVETKLNATWALGRIRDAQAIPALKRKLDDAFEGQRKVACFALGELGDASVADALAARLGDTVIDVRWNAALALARLKDKRAIPLLLTMLDRSALDEVKGTTADAAPGTKPKIPMNDGQRELVIVNAIRGVLTLDAREALPALDKLANEDRSYTVRRAAMEARDKLRPPAEPAK